MQTHFDWVSIAIERGRRRKRDEEDEDEEPRSLDFLWVSGLEEECQHFLLMGVTDEFDFVTGYVDAGFEQK